MTTIQAQDNDTGANQMISYGILQGNNDACFELNITSGALTLVKKVGL